MGSLIFFFFSAHQPALLIPDLELQVLRQVMIINATESELPDSSSKNEPDHARPLLQIFNGSPLCTGPHPNTRA